MFVRMENRLIFRFGVYSWKGFSADELYEYSSV